MRTPHLYASLLALLLSAPLTAQNGVYATHAFPGVCDGTLYWAGADSVQWSNGSNTLTMSAGPGIYGYTAYVEGEVMVGEYEIQNNGWEVQMQAWPSWDGLMLSGQVSVRYCGTSAFNYPCCAPETESTYLELLQDGEPFTPSFCMGCSNIWCATGSFMMQGLPYGYAYQLVIVDPTCAGTVMEPAGMAIAHSCANLEVITEVVDPTEGAADGSIHFVEAIPDPNEPYPISAPVTGTAMLMNATTQEVVGLFDAVGSATWDGLVPGYYILTFNADEGCQTYTDTLTVGTFTTGVLAGDAASGLSLFPAVTDAILQISSQAGGPVSLDIHDMHGRLVERTVVQGRVDVGHFPAGAYIATMQQGARQLRTRFIKR